MREKHGVIIQTRITVQNLTLVIPTYLSAHIKYNVSVKTQQFYYINAILGRHVSTLSESSSGPLK